MNPSGVLMLRYIHPCIDVCVVSGEGVQDGVTSSYGMIR